MWRPWFDNESTEELSEQTEDLDVKVIPETDLDNKVEETFQQTPPTPRSTPSHLVVPETQQQKYLQYVYL